MGHSPGNSPALAILAGEKRTRVECHHDHWNRPHPGNLPGRPEFQADTLKMLAQGRIGNAAEKSWGRTKRATDPSF